MRTSIAVSNNANNNSQSPLYRPSLEPLQLNHPISQNVLDNTMKSPVHQSRLQTMMLHIFYHIMPVTSSPGINGIPYVVLKLLFKIPYIQQLFLQVLNIALLETYDRVHPTYLRLCLQHFGLPQRLADGITSLFFNTSLCVSINGFISTPFDQGRGLRQGDPLSPLLFNFVLEPLLHTIYATSSLPGFVLHNPSIRQPFDNQASALSLTALAYADDIIVFLSNPEEIQTLMSIFSIYECASNARLNHYKTIAVSISGAPLESWQSTLSSAGITQWHDRSSPNAAIYLGFPLTSANHQTAAFL
ncbi:hypothetical protein G6F56_007518 [Rhizopus delemar]|nr:hypothetical protein G6F56_007518 [Rhizopus delemar]